MHTKKELDERLQAAGLRPLKQLGQNFLVNPEICQRIIRTVLDFKPASVVEVGPGVGALTDDLLGKDFVLQLVELDSGLAEYWKKSEPQVSLIHKDALKVDWSRLDLPGPRALVSNLPYSIAASLTVELSSLEPLPFDLMVLMFQKEVAERILAPTSDEDYGMLSVVVQCNWTVKKIIDAGPQDFHPVPNVGSRVLAFTPKEVTFDRSQFLAFVKLAFIQRRKKLLSNLGSRYPMARLRGAWQALNLSENCRAQELPPARWIELFANLTKA